MKIKTNEEFSQEINQLRKEGLDCIGELYQLIEHGAEADPRLIMIVENMTAKVRRFSRQYNSLKTIH